MGDNSDTVKNEPVHGNGRSPRENKAGHSKATQGGK